MSLDSTLPPFNAGEAGASFLSTSCLDFLMIELVPLSHRVTQQLDASLAAPLSSSASASASAADPPFSSVSLLQSPPPPPSQAQAQAQTQGQGQQTPGSAASTAGTAGGVGSTTTTAVAAAGTAKKLDEEEERDAVFRRLEALGYRVGQGLVERFSRDRPRFNDTLDVIKFLCKDIWGLVFGKQVDNLKTNHRGVYVLTDAHFRPIAKMSTEAGGQAVVRAKPFLCFPAGIVRGALAALGVTATVQAETTELPAAIFHIKTAPSKS